MAALANSSGLDLAKTQLFHSLAMTFVVVPAVLLVFTRRDNIPLKNLFNESSINSLGKFSLGAGLIFIPMIFHFSIFLFMGGIQLLNSIDVPMIINIKGAMAYAFF